MAVAIGYDLRHYRRFFITLRDVYDGAIVLFSDASGDALSLCRNFFVEIRSLPHNQHSIDLYYTDRFIGYDHVCSDYDSRPCLCLATSFFQAYPFCDMPANFVSLSTCPSLSPFPPHTARLLHRAGRVVQCQSNRTKSRSEVVVKTLSLLDFCIDLGGESCAAELSDRTLCGGQSMYTICV